jgi:hypothetical protein
VPARAGATSSGNRPVAASSGPPSEIRDPFAHDRALRDVLAIDGAVAGG